MQTSLDTTPSRKPKPRLRDMAMAYHSNRSNRAAARNLLAYVKRHPATLAVAEDYDIVALSLASELVGG